MEPEESATQLGLAELLHLPFGYLSAGQQRRMAIAKLLCAWRPVWLLDEHEIIRTMEQALGEGKRLDEEMTKLAEEEINPRMLDEEEGEENEEGEEDEEASSGNRRRESVGAGQNGNGRRKNQAGGGRK